MSRRRTMLRRKQRRGFMWAAAAAMGLTAAATWWTVVENGETGLDLVVPVGFSVAAAIWLANALVAKYAARATEGDNR
jgi:hypothetical protein